MNYNIFEKFAYSVTRPDFYKSVYKDSMKKALAYALIMVLLLGFAGGLVKGIKSKNIINVFNQILHDPNLPIFEFKDGRINFSSSDKDLFVYNADTFDVYIDFTGEHGYLDVMNSQTAALYISPDYLLQKTSDHNLRLFSLDDFKNIEFDKKTLLLFSSLSSYLTPIITLIFNIFILAFVYLSRACFIFLISLLFFSTYSKFLNKSDLFKMIIYATSLPLLLYEVLSIFPYRSIFQYNSLIYYFLGMTLFNRGFRAIASENIKK